MIQSQQQQNNFTYDWIVRTRLDAFWSAPLKPQYFIPGHYVVPPGSSYGGLNDRLGVGDFNTSLAALSRLSLIPTLDSAAFQQLNSETAFKAQLTSQGVPYLTRPAPFCVVTDRQYDYPPSAYGVPVAALSSRGPLSGAKCRPCEAACSGACVGEVMSGLQRGWSWTEWEDGSLELCDAHGGWEQGWEKIFDEAAGKEMGGARKRVGALKLDECVADFEEMRRRTSNWDAPQAMEMCAFGILGEVVD
jgi:hypothetical protein